jgi:hypothetical protein
MFVSPPYSYYRINALMHLVKLLALQGLGATVRFEALVEKVALIKRVNYGAGMENSVDDSSVKSDIFISDMQAGLAMQQQQQQQQQGRWRRAWRRGGRRKRGEEERWAKRTEPQVKHEQQDKDKKNVMYG